MKKSQVKEPAIEASIPPANVLKQDQDIENKVKQRTEDYVKALERGIEIGKQHFPQSVELIKSDAFKRGVRQMAEVAENKLAESLGLKSRQELSDHGDLIPAWWLASLFDHIWYDELPISSDIRSAAEDKSARAPKSAKSMVANK